MQCVELWRHCDAARRLPIDFWSRPPTSVCKACQAAVLCCCVAQRCAKAAHSMSLDLWAAARRAGSQRGRFDSRQRRMCSWRCVRALRELRKSEGDRTNDGPYYQITRTCFCRRHGQAGISHAAAQNGAGRSSAFYLSDDARLDFAQRLSRALGNQTWSSYPGKVSHAFFRIGTIGDLYPRHSRTSG